jgi:hypothetical protein
MMQKSLYTLLVVLLLSACQQSGNQQRSDSARVQPPEIDTNVMDVDNPPADAQVIPDTVRLEGDFNGDSLPDMAFGVVSKVIKGETPSEDEKHYTVRFSNRKIPEMPVMTGRIRMINEGDINGDGKDEITVFQEAQHGCTYQVTTWVNTQDKWKEMADPWLLPYYCEFISDEELQSRIVLEDGTVYFYQADLNDENATLFKKEMPLK